jgi:translation initiation factor 2 alpha subunit (eIF-2alpha)
VAPEDVAVCEERYNKSKLVHSIMRHVAETTGSDLNVRRLLRMRVSSPLPAYQR